MKKLKRRLEWVDYAKGIGIFLMVFGHTLRGLISSSILEKSYFVEFVNTYIYAFHMPLFFFLSGLFFKSSYITNFLTFCQKKAKTFIYPYFLWSLIQISLKIAVSSSVNRQSSWKELLEIVYDPVDQFWLIYTLFLVSVFFYIASSLGLSKSQLLIISVLLYAAHVFGISFGPWGALYLFRRHAIYFAIAAAIEPQRITLYINKFNILNKICFAIFLFGTLLLVTLLNLGVYVWAVPLIAMIGIIGTITIALVLESKGWAYFIKNWGKLTLQIYLAHTIVSALFRVILQAVGINDPLIHLTLGTIVGIYVPILIHNYSQKNNIKYIFAIP